MDAFSDPQVERIIVMTSAQVGKTEILNNIVGYFCEHDPNGPLSSKTIQYSTYDQRSERACWLVPFWSVLEDDVTVQKPEIFEN